MADTLYQKQKQNQQQQQQKQKKNIKASMNQL